MCNNSKPTIVIVVSVISPDGRVTVSGESVEFGRTSTMSDVVKRLFPAQPPNLESTISVQAAALCLACGKRVMNSAVLVSGKARESLKAAGKWEKIASAFASVLIRQFQKEAQREGLPILFVSIRNSDTRH